MHYLRNRMGICAVNLDSSLLLLYFMNQEIPYTAELGFTTHNLSV